MLLFSAFVRQKVTFNENVRFTDCAPGIRLPDGFKLAINRKNDNDVVICRHDFFWRWFVSFIMFSYWSNFHVNISTDSGVMIIFFIRDWPEIWKLEIPLSEFWLTSRDRGKLGIPNFARMSLITCYWMLQNGTVAAFTVSELLRDNQQVGKITLTPSQVRVKWRKCCMDCFLFEISKFTLFLFSKLL